jgi:hypothetical protein
MNNTQKLQYFDNLFTSGNLIPGAAIAWARRNNFIVRNVNDYFKLLLKMSGTKTTPKKFREFKNKMWKEVEFSKDNLRLGQVLKLVNKRFTGNQYVITALNPLGFDVYNQRLPRYKFQDLDYDSIDKILNFNL